MSCIMTVMEKETINSDWLELVLERTFLKKGKTEEERERNKKGGGGDKLSGKFSVFFHREMRPFTPSCAS